MRKMIFQTAILVVTLSVLLISGSPVMAASSGKDFYKGQTVKFVVPFNPGGGFDTYARALAPYIKKYTGAANVVIINKPGAGGNIAYNELFNAAKPDGLTICLAQGETLAFNKLWDLEEAKYTPDEFSFLGRVVWEETCTLLGTKSDIKSFEDIKKAQVVKAASPGVEDKSGTCVSSAFYALGLENLKKVVGYSGSREALAAALKNEADIAPGFSVGGIMKYIKAGNLVPLWMEARQRHPDLPNTPTIYELGVVKGREKPLDLYVDSLELGRMIIAPPRMPQETLRFLAGVVAQAINDAEYGKDLKKMKQDEPRFLDGEKTRALMQKIVKIGPDQKAELKEVVFKKGN